MITAHDVLNLCEAEDGTGYYVNICYILPYEAFDKYIWTPETKKWAEKEWPKYRGSSLVKKEYAATLFKGVYMDQEEADLIVKHGKIKLTGW